MKSLYLQGAVIILVSFINGFSLYVRPRQQHIPYINSMVMHFGLVDSENETGFYSGILDSLAMFGRIVSSPVWGMVSDRMGRKFVLLFSLVTITINILAFGLSRSFTAAFLSRFFLGVTAGIPVASKAAANEIEGGKYQARLMTLYSLGHSLGIIFGLAAGGLLAGVHLHQNFEVFPYFTPNFCCALLCMLSFPVVAFGFTETLKPSSFPKDNSCGVFINMLRNSHIRIILLLLGISSFAHSAMDELVTLWSWAAEDHGGLSLDAKELGFLLSTSVLIMEVVQQWMYTALVDQVGHVMLVKWDILLSIPAAFLLPYTYYLGGFQLFTLLFILTCWNMLMYHIYTSLFILANNSVPPHEKGKINGMALSFVSLFKATANIAAGVTFAWSLSINSAVFNFRFAFSLIALVCAGASMLSAKLERHLEARYQLTQKLL